MIQIQGRQQFTNAAARIRKERMAVRRYEAGAYLVINKSKGEGHSYLVRFNRIDGRVFGTCMCEAGTPSRRGARPQICKHLLSAILLHNAINGARRQANVAPAAIPELSDADDADLMEANY